jgi:hypothetical protein
MVSMVALSVADNSTSAAVWPSPVVRIVCLAFVPSDGGGRADRLPPDLPLTIPGPFGNHAPKGEFRALIA